MLNVESTVKAEPAKQSSSTGFVDTNSIVDSFMSGSFGKKTEPKAEEVKKEEPKAEEPQESVGNIVEDKKDDEVIEPFDENGDLKPIVETKPKVFVPKVHPNVASRDLSAFDDEDKELFKQMSDPAFQKFSQIYQDNKRLQTELPAVKQQLEVLQQRNPALDFHPYGYILNQEYMQKAQVMSAANEELEVLNGVLREMQEGRAGINLIRGQDGQLRNGGELPPTPQNIGYVIQQIAKLSSDSQLAKRDLDAIQANHKKFSEEAKAGLADYDSKMFGHFEKDPNNKKAFEQLYANVPVVFKSNPLTPLLVKAHITISQLLAAINESKKKNGLVEEQKKAGITNRDVRSEKSDENKQPNVSFADFKKFY